MADNLGMIIIFAENVKMLMSMIIKLTTQM